MLAPTVNFCVVVGLRRMDGWGWENIFASCYKGVVKWGVLVYN